MTEDARLNQIHTLLDEAVADAYERGRKDAFDAIAKLASGQTGVSVNAEQTPLKPRPRVLRKEFSDRKRAPRGSVETVIRRALDQNPNGATLRHIMDARESEGERMVADSSIRGDLRRGLGTKYKEIGDRWFYAKEQPQMQTAPDVNQGAAASVFE